MKDNKTQSTCPENRPDGIDNCNGQGLAVIISEDHQEEWITCPCKATDERLDPYGRFDGMPIPEWAEECCYNCAVPLYDEPGLPTKDGDEWYCEDCVAT